MGANSPTPDPRDVPEPNQPKKIEEIRNHPDNYWTKRNELIWRTTRNSTISVLASFISMVLALYVVYLTTTTQTALTDKAMKAQRELKEIDLRQNFLKRYEEIAFDQKERVKALRAESAQDKELAREKAVSYYRRFWDLQLEEYQFRCDGLIDERIYASWMDFRHEEYRGNEALQGITYQDGWKEVSDYFLNRERSKRPYYANFISFMEKVFKGETEADLDCPR